MLGFFKKLINKKDATSSDIRDVARCPKCGEKVMEHGDYWACVDILTNKCNFKMKNIINGKKMDIDVLINYQMAEQYEYLYNVINNKIADTKADKEKPVKNNLANKDKFFENAKMLKDCCINCGRPAYRLGDTVKCSDVKCNFTIKTTYAGVNFSDEQMSQLIGRRISEEYTFKNCSTGETFKGRVFIDFDNRIQMIPKYKFVDDISKLSDRYFKYIYAPDKNGRKFIPLKELLNN